MVAVLDGMGQDHAFNLILGVDLVDSLLQESQYLLKLANLMHFRGLLNLVHAVYRDIEPCISKRRRDREGVAITTNGSGDYEEG